jgi:hypothetical protein
MRINPERASDPLSLFNFIHNVYKREGSQARSTASGSGPDLAGVLGFESHPSHFYVFLIFTMESVGNIVQKIFTKCVETPFKFFLISFDVTKTTKMHKFSQSDVSVSN